MVESPRHNISDKNLMWFAWILWGMMFALVATKVIHSYTFSHENECLIYARATSNWWAGRNLYDTTSIDGFLYLPQAAIIYTPFALSEHPVVGDLIWRIVGLSLFCHGLWRVSKLLCPDHLLRIFALASFLALAPTYNALRNGQANLPIAAIMLHTAADLIQKRWWRATAWLVAGLAVKPIIFVMILLAGALYRPMSWRLLLAMVIFVLMPFATQEFHYVVAQYRQCRIKMSMSAQPDRAFSDLRGMFWMVGWVIPMSVFLWMQLIAAAATLALSWIASRRWSEPAAGFFVLALTACYLMLFNPRTEENSYVILTPVIALPAALLFLDGRRRTAAWTLAGISFWLTGNLWGYKLTVHWMKPLACIIFMVLLIRELLRMNIRDWPSGQPVGTPRPT